MESSNKSVRVSDRGDGGPSLADLVYAADKVERITDRYELKYVRAGYAVNHRPLMDVSAVLSRPFREWGEPVISEIHTVVLMPHTVVEEKLMRWYLALNDVTRYLRDHGDYDNDYIPDGKIAQWVWRTGLFVGWCEKCRLLQWAHVEPQIKPVFPVWFFPSRNQIVEMENRGHGEMREYM